MSLTGPDDPMIDLEALERNTFGSKPLRDEVLGLFKQQSIELLSFLGETTIADQWKIAAHKLKGSALGIGAPAVAQLAAAAERVAFNDGPASREEVLAPLRQAVEATNREIGWLLS